MTVIVLLLWIEMEIFDIQDIWHVTPVKEFFDFPKEVFTHRLRPAPSGWLYQDLQCVFPPNFQEVSYDWVLNFNDASATNLIIAGLPFTHS